MAYPLQAGLDAEWSKRNPNRRVATAGVPPGPPPDPNHYTGWSYRVTPPLPVVWPPGETFACTYHVYAMGQTARIADGLRMAAPWAFIEVRPNDPPELELLSGKIEEIGIQSVWPLRPGQAADFALGEAAESCLLALRTAPSAEQADLIRRFYRIWASGNDRLVREIRRFHEAFFKWLVE